MCQPLPIFEPTSPLCQKQSHFFVLAKFAQFGHHLHRSIFRIGILTRSAAHSAQSSAAAGRRLTRAARNPHCSATRRSLTVVRASLLLRAHHFCCADALQCVTLLQVLHAHHFCCVHNECCSLLIVLCTHISPTVGKSVFAFGIRFFEAEFS